jgi:hypothetical protein
MDIFIVSGNGGNSLSIQMANAWQYCGKFAAIIIAVLQRDYFAIFNIFATGALLKISISR